MGEIMAELFLTGAASVALFCLTITGIRYAVRKIRVRRFQ